MRRTVRSGGGGRGERRAVGESGAGGHEEDDMREIVQSEGRCERRSWRREAKLVQGGCRGGGKPN